jgi:invasion protein IalB
MSERHVPRQRPAFWIGPVLGIPSMLLLAGLTLTAARAAETTTPKGTYANEKPREAEIGPRGQRATREIKYGDWGKFCFKGGGAPIVCRTTISGTWETGQTAVRIDLIEREGDGTARLQIFLPVGLYLQAGVKLTVDQGAPYVIPYSWCMTNTCIAADLADPGIIREMISGQKLSVEVVDTNVLTITTTLPLIQFEAVRKGAPTQIFEQTIVE